MAEQGKGGLHIAPGEYLLISQGRETRTFTDARQAGAAFYTARRDEQPRVVQMETWTWSFTWGDSADRYEQPVALTAKAPEQPSGYEHVLLKDDPEFMAGYEHSRLAMPDKAVAVRNIALPTPPAQEASAAPTAPQPKGPGMDKDTQPAEAQNLRRFHIKGVDVDRLTFTKHSTEAGVFIDYTAMDRAGKVIEQRVVVPKDALDYHLGPTVGLEVGKFSGREGELQGRQLDVPAAEPPRPMDADMALQLPAAQAQTKARPERAASKQAPAASEQVAPTGRQMEINGLPVKRLAFIKKQTPEGLRYEVTAYGTGDKVLGKHPALRKEELAERLGVSLAKRLLGARGRNGSLRGDQLQLPPGEPRPAQDLSPEPAHEAKQVVVDAAVQAVAQEVVARVIAASPPPEMAPAQASEHSSSSEQEATAPAPSQRASLEMDKETLPPGQGAAPVVNSIERYDGPARAPQPGVPTPQKAARLQEAVAPQAAPATQAQAQDQTVSGSQPVPSEDSGKAASERRRQELLASLAQRFTINAGEYRFRSEQHRVAFVDRERTLTTDRNEPEVARAMVDLAEAKGWKTVQLKGTEPFRAAAWMEAAVRGLKSVGYEPTRADLVRLQERLKDQQINHVDLGHEPDAARQSPVQQQARQPVKPTELSEEARYDRAQALGVLERHLKDLNTPPEKMKAFLERGGKWLDEQAALGKGYPKAQVYDMNAQRQRQVHIQPQREQAAPSRSR
jgi:hypothetical protein